MDREVIVGIREGGRDAALGAPCASYVPRSGAILAPRDLTVRNLPDGRVELQVAGEDDEVRAFLDAILQSELRGHIRKHNEAPLTNPPPFRGFEIRHD